MAYLCSPHSVASKCVFVSIANERIKNQKKKPFHFFNRLSFLTHPISFRFHSYVFDHFAHYRFQFLLISNIRPDEYTTYLRHILMIFSPNWTYFRKNSTALFECVCVCVDCSLIFFLLYLCLMGIHCFALYIHICLCLFFDQKHSTSGKEVNTQKREIY